MPLLKRQLIAQSLSAAGRIRPAAVTSSGQRIRLGITGLGAIFLIVLVAAAGMRPDRSVAPAGAQGEPLAQLGITPSSAREAADRHDTPTVKPTRI